MAMTHTEVYRPYVGTLRARAFPWWPIASSGIALAWTKKLPILLLYAPVGVWTITHCFLVYAAFLLRDTQVQVTPQTMVVAAIAQQLLDVRGIISEFNLVVGHISILIMSWFGAGLIAEDRKAKAHLLYFSRPIRRLDYLLGKFGAIVFWGLMTSMLSGLLICVMAIFTSPDWIFLTEQYGTIFLTLAYSSIWILTVSSICLAVSSLVPKKTFGLVAIVAFFLIPPIISGILMDVTDVEAWGLLSPSICFDRIRLWLFASAERRGDWSEIWSSFASIAAFCGLAWSILAYQVRRLEVVG